MFIQLKGFVWRSLNYQFFRPSFCAIYTFFLFQPPKKPVLWNRPLHRLAVLLVAEAANGDGCGCDPGNQCGCIRGATNGNHRSDFRPWQLLQNSPGQLWLSLASEQFVRNRLCPDNPRGLRQKSNQIRNHWVCVGIFWAIGLRIFFVSFEQSS